MKNIEVERNGLQCDNPNCDWKDEQINFDNFKDYLNTPCPKCGENVLTETDYENTLKFYEQIDFINSLSEEQLTEMNKNFSDSGFKIFEGDDTMKITVDLHNGINIKDIEIGKNE
jgi:hypothetical protein